MIEIVIGEHSVSVIQEKKTRETDNDESYQVDGQMFKS